MKRIPIPTVENCEGCGVCCLEQALLPASYYVGLLKGQKGPTPELLAELQAEVDRCMREGFPEGPCIWYDPATKRCKHYEHRPDICRMEVKVNDEACHRWRREYGLEPKIVRRIVKGKVAEVIG